ncbi:MAG: hopanoid biosynthesis-associated protein HpnK [Salinisphaera sp.]|nr:hopanoid biosynthesis-associated protein HpnK [Salinisphaera sp.]
MTTSESARIIFTADDFGLDWRVNEAVENAVRRGVLTSASLMTAAPAAADAVKRAKALPDLRVGLHLVLIDGVAKLSPQQIPDLVDTSGQFRQQMARVSTGFFFNRSIRRQLAAEIRAQFEAFAATGLALDHVNAHKHFHLHPTIGSLIIDIGRDYGLRSVRLPDEPHLVRHTRLFGPSWLEAVATKLACRALRRRLDAAGIHHNDQVVGIRHTGHMTEDRLLEAIQQLSPGLTEIYLHPAVEGPLTPAMADYDHAGELAALISPRVRNVLVRRGLTPTHFSVLANA